MFSGRKLNSCGDAWDLRFHFASFAHGLYLYRKQKLITVPIVPLPVLAVRLRGTSAGQRLHENRLCSASETNEPLWRSRLFDLTLLINTLLFSFYYTDLHTAELIDTVSMNADDE